MKERLCSVLNVKSSLGSPNLKDKNYNHSVDFSAGVSLLVKGGSGVASSLPICCATSKTWRH
eukprot:m.55605 g.55605  ORF g.55605 m.55605 type:complete len:62 (+) comp22107_c1_seq1:215-400(+)